MNFFEKARVKFEKGAKEHGDWESIDPYKEIEDELLDIFNYFNHEKVSQEDRAVGSKFALFLYAMIHEDLEE